MYSEKGLDLKIRYKTMSCVLLFTEKHVNREGELTTKEPPSRVQRMIHFGSGVVNLSTEVVYEKLTVGVRSVTVTQCDHLTGTHRVGGLPRVVINGGP